MEPKWLEWVKQIQSIAQIGLTYAKDPYDVERYEALRQLSIDMVTNYTFMGKEQVELVFASEKGYATPKVDIRGVVFHQGKLLLVREKWDGAWSLPGGWADIGYSPAEIAVKEIKEESGFDVKPIRLLAVMDKKYHDHPPELYHVYKFFIECAIIGGEAKTGLETSGVDFFDEHHLPELSLERNTLKQIQTMFAYLHDPGKSVILD